MSYQLEGLQEEIFKKKYRQKDETIEDMWQRVASSIASVEGENHAKYTGHFYNLLHDFKFIPGGRISSGAGTLNNYLLNCAVLFVEDSIEGIYEAIKQAAVLAKCNYGVGFDFSTLRPARDGVSRGGVASGPVSFMRVFDTSGAIIETGGGRRAAAIGVLRVDHPDIFEFIEAKRETGVLTQFNISVGITQAFLDAVKRDDTFELVFNGKVYSTVEAKDIWKKLNQSGFMYNDPGLLMLDEVNKYNNGYYLYDIKATNPCLHPDSLVETVDGRVRIADIKEPTQVYTMQADGSLGIRRCSASWVSKKNAETLKVTIRSGKSVICTPDHLIYVKYRGWVKAQDLQVGDVLVQLCRARRGAAYSGVKLSTEDNRAYRMEHRMVAEAVYGPLADDQDVHHVDGNTYNNAKGNLEVLEHEDHCSHTAYVDHPQIHQERDCSGKFVATGRTAKRIIPMPTELQSNMSSNHSARVVSIEVGPVTDVYDLCVEDTHNFIADFIVVHNCGEIPLPPFGVCDLGNLNLTRYVKEPFKDFGKGLTENNYLEEMFKNVDITGYKKDIHAAVRFLDNVLDASDYPYPEIKERACGDRRIGLNGVAGFGSFLAMLRIPYDSGSARQYAKELQYICTCEAYRASIQLAKEKGPFPNFDKEKYLKAQFIKKLPEDIQEGIAEHGIRNLALLTIPPVGTGSLMAGNISNGLEPIFALEYTRKVRQPDQSSKDEAVEDYAWKLFKQTEEWKLSEKGSPKPTFFKTSRDIPPKAHIDVQAAFQEWIDGSISKTINMPEKTSLQEYEEAVWYAIAKGCKGFTSFREGTREGVLSTQDEGKKKDSTRTDEKIKSAAPKKKRPRKLSGTTYKIADDKGNLYITINDIEERGKVRPFEIFINSNGENGEYSAWYKALGKLLSAVMRRTDECTFIIKDLQSIFGVNGFFSDGKYVQSQPQMIGNILEEHYRSLHPEAAKEIKYVKCPDCGEVTYYKEGGCGKCLQCGFSSCG